MSARCAKLALLLLGILIGSVWHASAQAQVQVKPWFLVIVDTSGSMQDNCTNGSNNWPACNNCMNGCVTANSCGWQKTRISDAKCALRNILNSTGDAEFGLMQFTHPCRAACDSRSGGANGTCDASVAVSITADNYTSLQWVDGVCQGSCTGGVTQEIYAYGYTPIAQSLTRAKEYFSGTLAGFASPTATDTYAGCRPVAVIVLTDGDESCNGTPPTAAAALIPTTVPAPAPTTSRSIAIKTYAIGFGLTPGNTNIEALATAGQTDAPGAYRGFYAQNEEEISAALNQIITNSQLTERCDGRDNDCDTRIDEDNPKYCDMRGIRTANPTVPKFDDVTMMVLQSTQDSRLPACANGTCSAVVGTPGVAACAAPEWSSSNTCSPANILCTSPGEVCDRLDDDCDGKIDEGAPAIAGTNEICGDALDNDCDTKVDENCTPCFPEPEICNNKSDDCDGNIDENLTRACGTDVGECTAGVETCTAGAWGGCTAVAKTDETCNNKDDDCDGVIDGFTTPCGTSSTGTCRLGVRTCTAGVTGACTGQVDATAEICDNLDNDCDTKIDEAITPAADPRINKACGVTRGVCTTGLTICSAGEIACSGGVGPTAEKCDGLDNDCDGNIDEGVSVSDSANVGQPCVAPGGTVMYGSPVTMPLGECRLGTTVCSGGRLLCPGYVGPAVELCDDKDQDCDGNNTNVTMDPRVGAACGTSIGECTRGTLICTPAGQLVCNDVTPTTETCNGKDDDCDGLTDENLPLVANVCDRGPPLSGHGNVGECKTGRDACIGGVIVCAGEVTPTPEICDGKDNDCDTKVDEGDPGAGLDCGNNIGECKASKTICMNGQIVCPNSTMPSSELCDGFDNDCDGLTDEGNPQGGNSCDTDSQGQVIIGSCRTSVDPSQPNLPRDQACGECRFGILVCQNKTLVCIGTVGAGVEKCDGLDNDCDSPCVIDNSDPQQPVRKCPDDPCKLPESNPNHLDCDAKVDEGVAATDPNVGVPCVGGSGECKSGTEQCVAGVLSCVGGQAPDSERCNGKDDDCDTLIDEGFTLGAPCGTAIGECGQGIFVCDPATGGMACQNARQPTPERCDGLDNDCDGTADNGNPEGGTACGSDQGECQRGVEQCIAGKLQCAGAKEPTLEVCDCLDNDCDGKSDEQPSENSALCPGESQCEMCQCAQPCRDFGEFSVGCPQGKAPVTVGNTCLCVGERCNDTSCGEQTIASGDTVLCAPNSKTVGGCVCKNNECTQRCTGVMCSGGLICDGTDGRCKERSCLLPQFACAAGEFCDITTLSCMHDPCADAGCAGDKACRDGACLDSCASVDCTEGRSCRDGQCVEDRCQNKTCPTGQACDPTNGECVANGVCVSTGCRDGYVCNQVSGSCDADPCLRTTCPARQVCKVGECVPRCTAPLVDCDDICVNPASNRAHCGAASDCQGTNAGTACAAEEVCSEGKCSGTCKAGLVDCSGDCINPDSDLQHCGATGNCQGSQTGLTCPTGTVCRLGVCLTQATADADAGPKLAQQRISTTGGGGCACSVPGQAPTPRSQQLPNLSWLLLAIPALIWRRRLRGVRSQLRAAAPFLLGLSSLLFSGGCNVNTLCLNCVEDGGKPDTGPAYGNAGKDSVLDGSMQADTSVPTDTGVPTDAAPDPADSAVDSGVRVDGGKECLAAELCNGMDDDCDGKVDEGVDAKSLGIETQTDVNNCGVCGHRCVLEHAFSKCAAGACQIDGCDPEYVDFDSQNETGCEYRCTKVKEDDAICDHRDDDCDHMIDENVAVMTDSANCGSCGNKCEPLNAGDGAGFCEEGRCKLNPTKCNAGFVDADGVYANGCEYQCTPNNAGVEVCNAADDDCDRRIDEGVAGSDPRVGSACGVSEGSCEPGEQRCIAGAISCQGGRGPTTEICNNKDDDCDGNLDESFPQRGLPCGTETGECVRGNQQCMGGALVCVGQVLAAVESCDGKDNDCDGRTDEVSLTDGPPVGVGNDCKTEAGGVINLSPSAAVGECRNGKAQCISGALACANEIGIQPELCDDKDQNCDGDPLNGYDTPGNDTVINTACGTDVGECSFGKWICDVPNKKRICDNSNGKLPVAESCNGKDDDCDGKYDETDLVTGAKPMNVGDPCLIDGTGKVQTGNNLTVQGECKLGTSVCSGGVIACVNYTGPKPELCDTKDQDCDGDNTNGVASTDPGIGVACAGNNTGACRSGTTLCNNDGTVGCGGLIVLPAAEICDGIDNDCDGSLSDDGDAEPTLTNVCGSAVGACRTGTVRCIAGALQCSGATGPLAETCDTSDNDCDNKVDEDFQLQTNVNRCGGCNTACSFSHASAVCVGGTCQLSTCDAGYHDNKNTPAADCSVGPCEIAGNEICNGDDEDCDGSIDEGVTPPAGICNTVGACAGATATCSGGWVCSKTPSQETCNDVDDNCNGVKDEGFPLGQNCTAAGQGACATPGKLACTPDGSTTRCVDTNGVPVATGTPVQEICNGKDDDCDNTVDEPCVNGGPDTNCVSDAWVTLDANTDIYKYEASRADANGTTAGAATARACSGANRLPWTNLTYLQARAACEAAGPTARLCSEAEWEEACVSGATNDTCAWGFPDSPACNTWVADQCNGVNYTSTPDIQASGLSGARNGCYRGPSNDATKQIFEITGNVKEYVLMRDSGAIPVRGGASNNTQDGLRCDFDFSVWPNNTAFSNVGFRCCRGTALPIQCVTFQNTGLNVTSATLVTNALTVPLAGAISDINVVNFTGTHNTMSQVNYVELVGPDNTTIRLLNQAYCGNNDNWSYVFDSESGADLPVSNTSPCGNGATYKPYQSLAAFYGKDPYGTWTLRVSDNSSSNAASSPHINSWGIRVCVDPN